MCSDARAPPLGSETAAPPDSIIAGLVDTHETDTAYIALVLMVGIDPEEGLDRYDLIVWTAIRDGEVGWVWHAGGPTEGVERGELVKLSMESEGDNLILGIGSITETVAHPGAALPANYLALMSLPTTTADAVTTIEMDWLRIRGEHPAGSFSSTPGDNPFRAAYLRSLYRKGERRMRYLTILAVLILSGCDLLTMEANPPAGIELTPGDTLVLQGDEIKLELRTYDAEGNLLDIPKWQKAKWSSSDDDAVEVFQGSAHAESGEATNETITNSHGILGVEYDLGLGWARVGGMFGSVSVGINNTANVGPGAYASGGIRAWLGPLVVRPGLSFRWMKAGGDSAVSFTGEIGLEFNLPRWAEPKPRAGHLPATCF